VNLLQAVVYGIVQGVTEFLPVSSSGHLALYASLLEEGSVEAPLTFSILVHVASLLAVLIVFRRQVRRLFFEDRRLGLFICLATVPAVLAGLALRDVVAGPMSRPAPVAVCLMVTGLVLVAGEWTARKRVASEVREQEMPLWRILAVGVAQAFALLPGISRSGMTISAGRSLGLDRDASVRFAFLLAVPAIAGAACYEGLQVATGEATAEVGLLPAAAGFVSALVSSWAALVVLIRVVRRVGLWVFSPYCLLVGLSALVFFARR
jgi:undecaprenyl-diphosphatase